MSDTCQKLHPSDTQGVHGPKASFLQGNNKGRTFSEGAGTKGLIKARFLSPPTQH